MLMLPLQWVRVGFSRIRWGFRDLQCQLASWNIRVCPPLGQQY